MKKLSIISYVFIGVSFIVGCNKKAERVADFSFSSAKQAFLKVNYVSAYPGNPGIHIRVNGNRVSNVITARTPFPGGGYNTGGGSNPGYLEITPGTTELSIAIPNKNANTDSVVLFTKSLSFDAGKNYTVHITDTAANIKYAVINDDVKLPEPDRSKYIFINLMPNVAAVDLYYGTTLVASSIPYLGNSGYFNMQVAGVAATAWTIREAGTGPSGPALATYTSGNTILSQRIYTVFAIGYKGSTDAIRKPYVSFLLNR